MHFKAFKSWHMELLPACTVEKHTQVMKAIAVCWWQTIFKPDRPFAPHEASSHKWILSQTGKAISIFFPESGYYVQSILSLVCSPLISFSDGADKHLSFHNWHDSLPEDTVLFCSSEECLWPSVEHWNPILHSTLPCNLCVYTQPFTFLYLCVSLFSGSVAAVLPGYRKAICNGLRRNLHRAPVYRAEKRDLVWMQQEATADKYSQ